MKTVKMGALFLGNRALANPTNPTITGDIPVHNGLSTLEIREAPTDKPETEITWNVVEDINTWSRTGTLLVSDRVLIRGISEEQMTKYFKEQIISLNNEMYRVHLLPVGGPSGFKYCIHNNAWDDILDKTGDNDDIWHWKTASFWGRCRESMILRCGNHARDWRSSINLLTCGFRPALEPITIEADNVPPIGKVLCETLHVELGEMFGYGYKNYAILGDGLLYEFRMGAWEKVNKATRLIEIINCKDKIKKTGGIKHEYVYTGMVFGGFKFLYPLGDRTPNRSVAWRAKCVHCGKERNIRSDIVGSDKLPTCRCVKR